MSNTEVINNFQITNLNYGSSDPVISGTVTLTWSVNTNVDIYRIYRSTTNTTGEYALLHSTSNNITTSFNNNIPHANLTFLVYYYRITSVVNGIESDLNTAPTVRIVRYLNFRVTTITYNDNKITLSFTDNNPSESTTYNIYRSTTFDGTYAAIQTGIASATTSYQDTVPDASTTSYFYKITSIVSGIESDMSSAQFGHSILSPFDLSISTITFNTGLELIWSAIPNATEYLIYRATYNSLTTTLGDYTLLTSTTNTTYTETSLSLATEIYYYRIYSAFTNNGGVQVRSLDYGMIITPPLNIDGTTTATQVTATWDSSPSILKYQIVFSLNTANVTLESLDGTNNNTEYTFTNPDPESNKKYIFYVDGTTVTPSFMFKSLSSSTNYYVELNNVSYAYSNLTYTTNLSYSDVLSQAVMLTTFTSTGGGGSDPYIKSMYGKIIKLPNTAKKWVLFNDPLTDYSITANATNYRNGCFFNSIQITYGSRKATIDFSKHKISGTVEKKIKHHRRNSLISYDSDGYESASSSSSSSSKSNKSNKWYTIEQVQETFKYATMKDGGKIHEETKTFDAIVFTHETFGESRILVNWRNHYIHPYYKNFPKTNSYEGLLMMR
jgi:hypothetical protein